MAPAGCRRLLPRQRVAIATAAVAVFACLVAYSGSVLSRESRAALFAALPQSAEGVHLPPKPPQPAHPDLRAAWAAAFPDQPSVQVMVFTHRRAASLDRLLQSLATADYTGLPPHDLRVCVDSKADSPPNPAVLDVLAGFSWPHGQFEVGVHRSQVGLAGQWLHCWAGDTLQPVPSLKAAAPTSDERAALGVMLEDDLEVSRHWAQWKVRAALAYRQHPSIRSFTLQRPQIRATDAKSIAPQLPLEGTVFGYRLLGSWGFAAYRDMWRDFVAWQAEAAKAGPKAAVVPGLIMSDWWMGAVKAGSMSSMWTMWFIKFAQARGLFTLYGNFGGDLAMNVNWLEPGEHYAGTRGKPRSDSTLVRWWRDEYALMPAQPTLLDWDGSVIPDSSSAARPAADFAALVNALRFVTPEHSGAFPGLIIINSGYVDMTLSWLCNTADMPGVHRRTVIACTDLQCLGELRSHPAAARVGWITGLDLFGAVGDLRQAFGLARTAQGAQAAALSYATPDYILMMVARLRLLQDLVLADVPFLLFETDAVWASDAYAWMDRYMSQQRAELAHPAPAFPIDMLAYVDSPPQNLGGGFFLALPTPASKAFFSEWLGIVEADVKARGFAAIRESGLVSDQVVLGDVFKARRNSTNIHLMPTRAFPSGLWFRSHTPAQGPLAQLHKAGVVVLQNNFILGSVHKVVRAQVHAQWFLDARQATCTTGEAAARQAARVDAFVNSFSALAWIGLVATALYLAHITGWTQSAEGLLRRCGAGPCVDAGRRAWDQLALRRWRPLCGGKSREAP